MPLFSLLRSSACPPLAFHIPAASPRHPFTVAGGFPARKKTTNARNLLLQCTATSRALAEEQVGVIQNDFLFTKPFRNIVEDDTQQDKHKGDGKKLDEERDRMVEMIRSMLCSMEDGEISVSPYDTAWVALVEDIGGSRGPQFPTSLDWISKNQLADGSWGDAAAYMAHDRILSTLACVVALRTWKVHDDKADRGIAFIRKNFDKLEDENEEHMPIGFEVALPALIDKAKKLGIGVPDSSALQQIYAKRDFKLTRIPWDIMHNVPTTLLHSLEGMASASSGLEWHKLLKLQCSDGSFLFSPSSTAFALQQTKDDNCLQYLLKHAKKFNGGVPNVYPVDLFEHLWAVDRLQRLGISRYFQPEIEECVDYVHRYWTDKGISWARNSKVQDIDDTSMGFRLLRLHGYHVSADVFANFKQGNEFFCFAGQSNQAVTGMYNLYRASLMKFPGEDILEEACTFSYNFLQEKRAKNELLDKWIISKDLPGEVGYALDVPWYASLPRIETRFYLEQYGGDDDVWIGKTLYRMPIVNNKTYLDLAKLDYNSCQAVHNSEWKSIQRWYSDCRLGEFGLSERSLLQAYYIAAASIFEPERSHERLAWAKTSILMETISSYFDRTPVSKDEKRAFIREFEHGNLFGQKFITKYNLVGIVITTLNELSLGTIMVRRGVDIHQHLYHAWHKWLSSREGDIGEGDADLLVCTLTLCSGASKGRFSDELLLSHPMYQRLLQITTRVCHNLRVFRNQKTTLVQNMEGAAATTAEIEQGMQEMVKLVLVKNPGRDDELDSSVKQNFLDVARSYYYSAYCSPESISYHMTKVLFLRV